MSSGGKTIVGGGLIGVILLLNVLVEKMVKWLVIY
jgi:hypothetical protein